VAEPEVSDAAVPAAPETASASDAKPDDDSPSLEDDEPSAALPVANSGETEKQAQSAPEDVAATPPPSELPDDGSPPRLEDDGAVSASPVAAVAEPAQQPVGRERPRMGLMRRNGVLVASVSPTDPEKASSSLAAYSSSATPSATPAERRPPRAAAAQPRKQSGRQDGYVIADLPPVEFPKAYYATSRKPAPVAIEDDPPPQAKKRNPSRLRQFRHWVSDRLTGGSN
jgi:hypothetical protein